LAGTYSSIFLTSFHILLGTLTGTPDEVDGRLIYYKHADARFFQAGAFLLGKQISQLPLLAMEIIAFGLPFYFIAGLAYEARAFFVFLAILIGAYRFLIACPLLHSDKLTSSVCLPSSLQILIENVVRSTGPDSTEEGQCAGSRHSLIPTPYTNLWVHCIPIGDSKLLEMALLGQSHGMGAAGHGVESVLVIEVFRVFM
jgi:hypothetical protein